MSIDPLIAFYITMALCIAAVVYICYEARLERLGRLKPSRWTGTGPTRQTGTEARDG